MPFRWPWQPRTQTPVLVRATRRRGGRISRDDQLTMRELSDQGWTTAEIADELGYSVAVVRRHLATPARQDLTTRLQEVKDQFEVRKLELKLQRLQTDPEFQAAELGEPRRSSLDLAQLADTVKQARAAGFPIKLSMGAGEKGGDGPWWKELITAVADTEMGVEIARQLGPALRTTMPAAADLQRAMQGQASAAGQAGTALAPVQPPPLAPPAPVTPPTQPAQPPPPTPAEVLDLLEHAPVDDAARQLVAWSQHDQNTGNLRQGFLESTDEELVGELQKLLNSLATPSFLLPAETRQQLADAKPWAPVLRWLIDHGEQRVALAAALRSAAAPSAAPTPSLNGVAHPASIGDGF